MTLPADPLEVLVLALGTVAFVLAVWIGVKNTLSGFLPAERIKVPKPGKLERLLSPHLKSFVASLPRPVGDPLAEICQPIAPGTLPYFDNHGYVNALYPLWKCGAKHSVAVRSWSRRKRERTEFVWCGDQPGDDWDVRALSEQGFFADTLIDLMQTLDWSDHERALKRTRHASDALGFRHFDHTVQWFSRFTATDWTKLTDEDDDESVTAEERAHAERFCFVRDIPA